VFKVTKYTYTDDSVRIHWLNGADELVMVFAEFNGSHTPWRSRRTTTNRAELSIAAETRAAGCGGRACHLRGAPKIASVSASSSKDFAMNYSAVTRIDVAPFALLMIAAVILASCSTSRTDAPTAEAAPPPLTQSKAAEQCWMETEQGAKSLPAEKRAKVVDQCVKDKMSAAK
jgi:hypothetical protein